MIQDALMYWSLYIYVTWSNKMGLIAHSQVLRYNGFNFSKCCSSPMKVATHIRFSHYLIYFQYHPEYKKLATMFPAILDSFCTIAWPYQVSGNGWWWGRWEGRVYELGRCKGKIGLIMGTDGSKHSGKSAPQVFIQHHKTWQAHTATHGSMKTTDCSYGSPNSQEKTAQKKQTNYCRLSLTLKSNSAIT